jgi:hypothetical protein
VRLERLKQVVGVFPVALLVARGFAVSKSHLFTFPVKIRS